MQMLDLLAAIRPHVGKHPIATLPNAQPVGDAHHESQQRAAQSVRTTLEIVERDDVLAWHHQDMLRRLGVEVTEGYEISIFENDGARDLPPRDPTEYAVVHGG